jgi:hypothetical protein
MHMAKTSLVRSDAHASPPPPADVLQEMVRLAQVSADDLLEHVHISSASDRVDITVFLQAGSQDEADAAARLIGARVCGRLHGWGTTP